MKGGDEFGPPVYQLSRGQATRLVKVMDEGYHPKEDTRDNSLCIT